MTNRGLRYDYSNKDSGPKIHTALINYVKCSLDGCYDIRLGNASDHLSSSSETVNAEHPKFYY